MVAVATDKDGRIRVPVAQVLARMGDKAACTEVMQLFVDGAGITDRNGDIALIRSLTPLLAAEPIAPDILKRVATPGKDKRGRPTKLNTSVVSAALESISAPPELLVTLRAQKSTGIQAAAAAAQLRQGITDAAEDAAGVLNALVSTPGTGRREQGVRQDGWRQLAATPQWQPDWQALLAGPSEVRQSALLAMSAGVHDAEQAKTAIALLLPIAEGDSAGDATAAASAVEN